MIDATDKDKVRMENAANTVWMQMADEYEKNHRKINSEYLLAKAILGGAGLNGALMLLCAASVKIQVDFAERTGKILQVKDFME